MQTRRSQHFDPSQRLVIVGFGCIARLSLRLLIARHGIQPRHVVVIDPCLDVSDLPDGVQGMACEVTRDNHVRLLTPLLGAGTLLLNLATSACSRDLALLAHHLGANYLDTCTDPWTNWYGNPDLPMSQRTNEFLRSDLIECFPRRSTGPTALMTHGMNPGIISHFVKKALVDIANSSGRSVRLDSSTLDWAELACDLDVRLIQIAEYDSQQINVARQATEFMNTWSVEGFLAEAAQPAETSWGTHERWIPEAAVPPERGIGAYFTTCGANTGVKSWCPDVGPFQGLMITHAEAISIASFLERRLEGDQPAYRPTVHYAYRPSDATLDSLAALKATGWQREQLSARVLGKEIVSGHDRIGALLGLGDERVYWYGSVLDVTEARAIDEEATATSLQVAAGVIAGMLWVMSNPHMGLVEPEQIDSEFVLDVIRPYMGRMYGTFADWTPCRPEPEPWQLTRLLVDAVGA